jgi:phosphoenolpyruvate carboxykinase (ATP)
MDTANVLEHLGLKPTGTVYYNLAPAELVEHTLKLGQGTLADSGGLCVATGEFTGRSPKDKYVVRDANTENTVWWGDINHPYATEDFERLLSRVQAYIQNRPAGDLYVRDCLAGADPAYQIKVRVINEHPWQNLFANHLFLRPTAEQRSGFTPDWTVLAVPGFMADPAIDHTRQHNCTIIDFTRKIILICGSAYTGEIKKGIFTVMNYELPFKGVLPMHCSANIGEAGDVAIFFGLSGTGKTTLSADPARGLIGDDEHGWTESGVFNFEGGCYAKCIDLSAEKEPQIWNAIRFTTLVENTIFQPGTRTVDYGSKKITENTRAAYPIDFIDNAVQPSVGGLPKNIFLLTADATGVLPPIARLDAGQAMYLFISGFTSKVAGTEAGVTEPQLTFSACFGQAFLPLHPTTYAKMLGEKMNKHNVNVWLVNTGWNGRGERMKLGYTRAMITAALNGALNNAEFEIDPVFRLQIPKEVPGVPSDVLNQRNSWADTAAFDARANDLADKFNANFQKFADFASDEIKAAAPRALTV